MTYRLFGAAMADVLDIADWYNAQRAGLGDEFVDAVELFAAETAAQPRRYGRVPRAPAGREVREAMLTRFPYIVAYEVTPTEVVILSVTHGRTRRRPWRRRL